MSSFKYIARNVADLAVLSSVFPALSTDAALGNIQKNRRARVFRWNPFAGSPSGQSILGTYNGASYWVAGIGIDRNNFSSTGTFRFRGYNTTDESGAATVDTGTLSAFNAASLGPFTWGQTPLGVNIRDGYLGYQYSVATFARTLIKSWRLDINDEANTAGYNQFSRLILGDWTEHLRSAAWSIKFGWQEKTVHEQMDGGTTISDGKLPRRIITGVLPGIITTPGAASDERALYVDFTRFVGMRQTFLISVLPDEGANLTRDFTIFEA